MRIRMKLLLSSLALLALVCGCRNQIEVDGEHYDMLNDDEVAELVILARETLLRNSEKLLVPVDEAAAIRRMDPEMKIDYRGDCSGEAVVTWDMPRRKYEVVLDGQLNESSPFKRNLMVRIMKKHGPVLDFRESQRALKGTAPARP